MANTNLILINNVTLPVLGFGVFQTPADQTAEAVAEALRVGYRHVDTAAAYGNEKGVGEALAAADVPRDEVFVETKLWISDYGYDAALHGFEKSAAKLNVDYIDLLLLHQPLTSNFDLTLEAYRAMESLYTSGKVRAIGVSNFMPEVLSDFLTKIDVVPAVNQIEVHPYFQQRQLQALHAEHGIITQAWSPIGGVTIYGNGQQRTLDNEILNNIAEQHGKSPAQVMLRWHIQEGRSAIPKSVKPARITENFEVFDFTLTDQEIDAINALDTGTRSGPEPSSITLESHGTPIPEA
ncbi:MAG TPA: aldo/keto reductase [Candidatus Yaniella excrementigallinarum]|nr:aldo/keto reductase [Candidatus Yaniella excrementigallinarum]